MITNVRIKRKLVHPRQPSFKFKIVLPSDLILNSGIEINCICKGINSISFEGLLINIRKSSAGFESYLEASKEDVSKTKHLF